MSLAESPDLDLVRRGGRMGGAEGTAAATLGGPFEVWGADAATLGALLEESYKM